MARTAAAAAAAIIALAVARPAAAERLVLQLDGPAGFKFAGYYAALWRGFYRDAGLEVEIAPGGAKIDPVRELIAGRAQFGTGSARLLIRAAEGLPILMLAPIFQESGAAIYYPADRNFRSLTALLRARIGRLPAGSILDLESRTAFGSAGIDADRLRSVALRLGDAADALADGQADAAIGTAWDLPWRAKERGLALKSFDPAAYRAAFYGDGLFTLQRFAEDHATLVARFRAASLAGWDNALRHRDEVAARLAAEFPAPVADPADFARYQSDVAARLARYPAVTLGTSDPARWRRIEQSLLAAAAIARPADLDRFLYRPTAPRAMPPPALWIVLAVAALLLAATMVWRRRLAELSARLPRWATAALEPLRKRGAAPAAAAGADLAAMLSALEPSLRRALPRRVGLRLSLPPQPWLCRADPVAVAAAVRELAAGAAADMPRGGELTLGTRHRSDGDAPAPGEFVRLTVRDSGPGLSPECLDTVFDPARTARPAIAAAGAMAREQNGFACVDSAEGVGTAVHLYFERLAAAAAVPIAAQ